MVTHRSSEERRFRKISCSTEHLAIAVLRRMFQKAATCPSRTTTDIGFEHDIQNAADWLYRANSVLRTRRGKGLEFESYGSIARSSDEAILIDAVIAAQAGDTPLADHLLAAISDDHDVLEPLSHAMTDYAACLAVAGYWLADDHWNAHDADAADALRGRAMVAMKNFGADHAYY